MVGGRPSMGSSTLRLVFSPSPGNGPVLHILGPGSASSSSHRGLLSGPSYSGIIRIFLVGTAWPLDLFEAQFPNLGFPWILRCSSLDVSHGRPSPVIQLMMLWVQDAPIQPVLKRNYLIPYQVWSPASVWPPAVTSAASTNLSIPNSIRQMAGS